MLNNSLVTGFVFLAFGLLASSIASFASRFMLLGTSTNFACGFLDGVAAVFFGAAIWFLIRSRRTASH
jgi:hypothetical protein